MAPDARFSRLVEIAHAAEAAGFDSLWVGDHFRHFRGGPLLEPFVLLGSLAAITERIRLGVLVSAVTFRHPSLLAKLAATLDVVSSGRAILGLGAGTPGREHQEYGLPFPPLTTRLELLEETAIVCRSLFRGEGGYRGRHYQIEAARLDPPPIQADGPPILIGGKARGVLRIAARLADLSNFTYTSVAGTRRLLMALDFHCRHFGRHPGSLRRSWMGALIVAPTSAEARLRGETFRAARGMSEDLYEQVVPHGTPEQAAAGVRSLLDSGLDEIYLGLTENTVEAVETAGNVIALASKAGG